MLRGFSHQKKTGKTFLPVFTHTLFYRPDVLANIICTSILTLQCGIVIRLVSHYFANVV